MAILHPTSFMKRNALFVCALLCEVPLAVAQSSTNLTPKAEQVLRAASQYLAEAPFFTASAEVWRERVAEGGQKLQFTRVVDLTVRRPNRLHVEVHSGYTDRGIWYDGKALTILDRKANLFSTSPMPATIDAALDAAHDDFGIDLPLIDLAVSDPYKNATARILIGKYFGESSVLGVPCHHLAFIQDNIDWQLWVETGPRPLIRKLIITHKNDAGEPELTALITKWNFADRIADSDFVFEAPAGSSKIDMRRPGVTPSRMNSEKPAPSSN